MTDKKYLEKVALISTASDLSYKMKKIIERSKKSYTEDKIHEISQILFIMDASLETADEALKNDGY